MADTIRLVTKSDFPVLKELLKKKLPSSLSILCIIEVTDRFQISRKIYVTNSDPTLFIFATQMRTQPPCFCTYWDIERTTKEEAFEYLKSVPDWNWNEKFGLLRIESNLANCIDKMILEGGLSPPNFQKEFSSQGFSHELSPQSVPEVKIPEGFKIGKLKPHHAKYVMSTWHFNEGENVSDYEELIRKLPTAAVYREDDNEQETPISWSIVYNFGAFGMTYTVPEFRRLGLATATEISVCKKLIEENLPATGDVEVNNEESLRMHQKAGFKIVQRMNFDIYVPAKN